MSKDDQLELDYAPLPRTRARTAIGILKAVAQAIVDEPRRYRQSSWIKPAEALHTRQRPACGTAACVAGWVVIVTRDGAEDREDLLRLGDTWVRGSGSDVCWHEENAIAKRARRTLQISRTQAQRLFDSYAVTWHGSVRRYANAGVEHIEQFMRDELGYTGPKLPRK